MLCCSEWCQSLYAVPVTFPRQGGASRKSGHAEVVKLPRPWSIPVDGNSPKFPTVCVARVKTVFPLLFLTLCLLGSLSLTSWWINCMSNDASGSDRIPAEIFKTLKDDPVKVLHSICQQIWKPHHWPQDWKRSVFSPIPKRAMPKNVQTNVQLHSFYMLARLCSKSFKFQQYMNWELSNIQARFRKDKETRDQIANIWWIVEKARECPPKSTSALLC